MKCHVCSYALEVNLFFQMQRQDARLPSARSMATHLVTRRGRGSEAGPHQCNPPHFTPCAARCHQDLAAAARAHGSRWRRRRRREEEAQRVYGWRGGAASFRRADTAKVCSNVGLLVALDGEFDCRSAVPATQGVSGRLRARQGLRHQFLAATSAFDATSTRHVSTEPPQAECIRGVPPLKNK
jgi:hypothetical protein